MIPSFIITFRESLEASLIVGIILSYLARTKQTRYIPVVYMGVISGIVASIIGAILFNKLAGGFSGRTEKLFEGTTMLIGTILLTTMILWMMKQKQVTKELEKKVAAKVASARRWELFLLVFVAVLREGIETVIFLQAASFVSTDNSLWGALAGLVVAVLLGYALFVGSMKLNLKRFFNTTSVILILFAAGLLAHGVHEFQEAGAVPVIVEHVWDVNPAVIEGEGFPLLHEKGHIGSIMKGLFGYNGNPSLIEVLSYAVYLVVVVIIWKTIESGKRIEKNHGMRRQRTFIALR